MSLIRLFRHRVVEGDARRRRAQLYEVTSLQITAEPTNMNEGGIRQLTAMQLLDDATVIVLSPTEVIWRVQSGPLTGIEHSGRAVDALSVSQGDYAGLFGNISLTVFDTNSR